ncbi:MAG: WD40 repeat domain-containing protein [Cyanobacteria bacterium M_surface_10_m2_119]|nr:WD40 repeat domain-containing protein [Cyanobacteria bacterium M_surface_10_m2_119]
MADGSGVDVVMAMAFTADGDNVLLGCRSGAVELRSLEGQLRFRQQPKMHHIQRVAVTPDGRVLLMLSGNTIHLWSASGASLGRIDTTVCEGCSTNTMVVSPDGEL